MNEPGDSMSHESSRQGLLWLGFLGLVVLWFFALIFHAPAIERTLGQAVRERLVGVGFERIDVETRGRDVLLVGEVSGKMAAKQAKALASQVQGVRVVHDVTQLVERRLPWLRFIRGADGSWAVDGVLPETAAWDRLMQALNSRLPDHFEMHGHSDVETGDPEWIDDLGELLEQIGGLERGRLEIGANSIEVGGMMTDIALHSRVEQYLTRYAESGRMSLVNRIALMSPRTTQPTENSAN